MLIYESSLSDNVGVFTRIIGDSVNAANKARIDLAIMLLSRLRELGSLQIEDGSGGNEITLVTYFGRLLQEALEALADLKADSIGTPACGAKLSAYMEQMRAALDFLQTDPASIKKTLADARKDYTLEVGR